MEPERHPEPHVSGPELRAALAPGRRARPNPLMTESPPAWEWTEPSEEDGELRRLRDASAALQAELEDLERAMLRRENELRAGLRRLSSARIWERRRVLDELAERGLL
jgi:hypothetical protein